MSHTVGAPRAIIIGAGISGLTAAHDLHRAGWQVTVLEAASFVGGKMSSVQHGDYRYNRAANILPTSYKTINRLIADVDLTDQMRTIGPRLGILRDGRVREMRASGMAMLIDGLKLDLISPASKLKLVNLGVDAIRMRSSLSYENLGLAARFDTESAADYARRRLNEELLEYLVEPIVRGLYTSNADRVSVIDFFFAAVNFIGSGFTQYPGGIDFLCRALADEVGVTFGARAQSVVRDGDSVTVTWSEAGQQRTQTVDAAIVAVSAHEATRLYPQLNARQKQILDDEIEYCTTFAGHFGLTERPDEVAQLVPVPKSESRGLCVVTFDHNQSPTSAPAGAGILSSYWLHDWSIERTALSDDELIAEMLPEVEKVSPGVSDTLAFTAIDRWNPAVVRSYPGMYAKIGEYNALIDSTSPVQLAGDFLTASSTNGCAVAGELAAKRLIAAVR